MTGISFAIAMELDGEKYYREQAEINRGNALHKVFDALAEDESRHADALRKWQEAKVYDMANGRDTLFKSRNVFADLADFKLEAKTAPSQLDVYRMALEMERKSIDLYEQLLLAQEDTAARKLFERLIREEKEHFAVLEEIVVHVGRPEEWVEAAEFGRRKEY